ncbi:MAG: 50S ribosomal protein L13 [Patescibacteria group bacterium]
MKNYTIDATGESLGRVASRTAMLLRGKGEASFQPHLVPHISVTVTNASKLQIQPAKFAQTQYRRYSGYPGGLKQETMANLALRRGYPELFRQAVKGMLPNNKLRRLILKQLTVTA